MVFRNDAYWVQTPRYCALTIAIALSWPHVAQAQVASGGHSAPAAPAAPRTTPPHSILV
jgi:hypothetical protein